MDDRLDVRELGAKGDDRTDDNAAIQAALDQVAGTGGTVFVPPGRYHVGTLLVCSRTTLELAAGATIVGPETLDRFIRQDYAKGDTTVSWRCGGERTGRATGGHAWQYDGSVETGDVSFGELTGSEGKKTCDLETQE